MEARCCVTGRAATSSEVMRGRGRVAGGQPDSSLGQASSGWWSGDSMLVWGCSWICEALTDIVQLGEETRRDVVVRVRLFTPEHLLPWRLCGLADFVSECTACRRLDSVDFDSLTRL